MGQWIHHMLNAPASQFGWHDWVVIGGTLLLFGGVAWAVADFLDWRDRRRRRRYPGSF